MIKRGKRYQKRWMFKRKKNIKLLNLARPFKLRRISRIPSFNLLSFRLLSFHALPLNLGSRIQKWARKLDRVKGCGELAK